VILFAGGRNIPEGAMIKTPEGAMIKQLRRAAS
jgi:hypothetical protein